MKSLNRAVDAIREQDARMERPPLYGARMWRQVGHLMLNLPLGIAGFVLSVTALSVGLGLSVTVIGLPVLAAGLAGSRALGAQGRNRARSVYGSRIDEPEPVRPRRPGMVAYTIAHLTDLLNWRSALYNVLMLP